MRTDKVLPSGVERRRTRGFCRRTNEKLSVYFSFRG